MIKNKSAFFYITGGICVLAIIVLLARIIFNITFRKQIPPLPDLNALSAPLKEQLLLANKMAIRKPLANNIGMMGMTYHSSAYYEKAALCYKLAIKRDKTKWIWSYYLGYLNREMGDPKTAIMNFKDVIKINPGIFLASYYEGECYQKLGSNDSAAIVFKGIIGKMDRNTIVKSPTRYDYFPLVTYTMYNLARVYMSTGQADLAEKILLDIVDYQRAFGPAYRILGNVYNTKGDQNTSKRYLVRANDLTINPTPVDTLIDRLSLMSRSDLYILKKIDEAEKNVFPEYALELVNHSLTCISENKYLISKAIELFLMSDQGNRSLPYLGQHIAYFHNDFDELKDVGDLLYKKAYYPQALNYYSQAAKLKPDDSQVESCLIICLSKTGKKEQALSLIEKRISMDNKNPVVLADGVTLLLTIGEKEKAIGCLDRLRKVSPNNSKGQQIAGMLSEQTGKWQEALNNYSLSFKTDPADLTIERLLCTLQIRQKMWKEAISSLRKALEYHPNEPFLLERLGTILVTCADPGVRDLNEGKYYCERAFINTTSHSVTLISAGRSLAIAYELGGDNRNASNIIKMTINLANGENIPSSYITDLRNLLQQFAKSN